MVTSVRTASAPQWEQNFAPRNINPKQEGQAAVAKRAPQWSQRDASVAAAAPHIGQFRVSASMVRQAQGQIMAIKSVSSHSGQQFWYRVCVCDGNICQAVIAAIMRIGQFAVIQPEGLQQRGVKIVNLDDVLD